MTPEQTVRLLRAKVSEWEAHVQMHGVDREVDVLKADVALIAAILADHIESTMTTDWPAFAAELLAMGKNKPEPPPGFFDHAAE